MSVFSASSNAARTPAASGAVPKGDPGLQHIQKTGVVVTVYPVADMGITQKSGDLKTYKPVTFDGRTEHDPRPSVVSCTTTNALQSGGSFSVTVKAGQYGPLIDSLADDSWVDISFTNDGKSWHVMRGLVDEVRQAQTVGASGAYTATHTIIGRSFQKIWADTPYWFNPNAYENLQGELIYNLLRGFAGADPKTIIDAFLRSVLYILGKFGRGTWAMPPQMPNANGEFASNFALYTDHYNFYGLPLVMPAASVLQTAGTGDLWSIAHQFSDSSFTELFTEQALYIGNNYYVDAKGTLGAPIADTQMTVVLRDKPFLTVDPVLGATKAALKGPFFSLPKFGLPRQAIQSMDVGIAGYERYNAFFTTPPTATGATQADYQFFQRPLWFPEDMQKHGLRRMDISSAYLPDGTKFAQYGPGLDIKTFLKRRRALIRDWYCMGAVLRSGTLSLGCGAPHLRIGCRLLIPSVGNIKQESYYIESVTHAWSMPQGTRTQVGVTRGFVGTDAQLLAALSQVSQSYVEAAIIGGG